jgi:hypothetical protein
MGLLIAILTVLILVCVAAFGIKGKKTKVIEHQLDGLEQVSILKKLLGFLQKHRGVSAAYIQGDQNVFNDLVNLKSDISAVSLQLEAQLEKNDRWIGFKDHWSRLSSIKQNVTAENSFKQHTHMISNVVYLLEDIAEKQLLTAEYLPHFTHIGYVWRELVSVTESVGQSRAVGTSAVTAGSCSSVERIRLKFLRQHITQVSEKVLKSLRNTDQEMNNLIDDSLTKTRYLTSVIVNEILDTESIAMSRSTYFDLATDAMAALNTVFTYQVQQIQQDLKQQK